jgi:hypothetical protein
MTSSIIACTIASHKSLSVLGSHDRVRIVTLVGHEVGQDKPVKQRQCLRVIFALAVRQAAAHKPAPGISHHGQFARQPATAASEGLRSFFLRSARVLMRPHGGRVHQQRVQGIVLLHGG